MTKFILACIASWVLATCGLAQTTNKVLHVPVAQLQEIWTEYLDQGMVNPELATETREWFCRTRLAQQADHLVALESLTRQWIESDDKTLALAAMRYAQSLGVTNFSHDVIALLTNHAAIIVETERDEPFIQTRVEMITEDLLKSRAYLHLEEFITFERKLRNIIRQSNDRQEALESLIQLYEIQQDPLLPTILTRIALDYAPDNLLMIERYLQGLQSLGKDDLATEFLGSYATRKGLDLEVNKLMSTLSLTRDRPDLAFLFVNAWSMQAPDDAKAWQLLGQIQASKRQDDQAMHNLIKSARLPGHDPEVYRQIALVAERKADLSRMAFWLSRWHTHAGDDALLELLQNPPFNRHPGLLKELK